MKFDSHLGSAAADMPAKFQGEWKSLEPNPAASSRVFTISCGKTSYHVQNGGPAIVKPYNKTR